VTRAPPPRRLAFGLGSATPPRTVARVHGRRCASPRYGVLPVQALDPKPSSLFSALPAFSSLFPFPAHPLSERPSDSHYGSRVQHVGRVRVGRRGVRCAAQAAPRATRTLASRLGGTVRKPSPAGVRRTASEALAHRNAPIRSRAAADCTTQPRGHQVISSVALHSQQQLGATAGRSREVAQQRHFASPPLPAPSSSPTAIVVHTVGARPLAAYPPSHLYAVVLRRTL
jgi:hypothetical protein